MRDRKIFLGYEVGTGDAVEIPIRHLAVTGQTQQSGKTTTLEALAIRSGASVLTFITKRGEGSFDTGRRVSPYFRDRADWQFVTSILDATLQEKNKFLRPWIMKICRSTTTLAEVQREVRRALQTAKGINEGVYTQLDAYLDLIVPEIQRAHLAPTLDLHPGVNVMDVSSFATPMQMLFVQSALDWVNDQCRNTIVVIPEAWEFIPEGKGSPVKASAITLVRKGAGIGNFIWVDSQDMAGVDKTILRGCTVWLLGVQREANEIKRNLLNIPAGIKRPKAEDVALLGRGQFFASFGPTIAKVYVCPAWMPETEARGIALGHEQRTAPPEPQQPKMENQVTEAEAQSLRDEIASLRGQVAGHPAALERARAEGRAEGERHADDGFDAGLQAAIAAVQAVKALASPKAAPAKTLTETPVAPKALDTAPPATDGDLSQGALALLDILATVSPNRIPAELWAAFAQKAPSGGHWNGQVKSLRDRGLVDSDSGGYAATPLGLATASAVPAGLKSDADMFAHFRDAVRAQIEPTALSLLSVLQLHHPHALTAQQWGLLAGKSASGGHWNGAVKALRDWQLVTIADGRYAVTPRGDAMLETRPQKIKTTVEDLRRARRLSMSSAGQRLFDGLRPGMTRAELASALSMKPTGGHWNGALKELLESGLVVDQGGKLVMAQEALAS